jgi:hypothetical protein
MPTVQHGLRASLSRQNAPASGAFQDWRRGAAARGAGCSTAGRVPDERAYLTARAAKDAPPPATPPPQPATLLTLPLFHLGGLESFLLPFTASGGKVVLMYKWDAARRRSSEGSCIGLCPASESRHLSSGAAPRDRTGSRQSPRPTIQQLTWPCVPRARHRPAVPRPAPHQLGRRPGRRWLGHPAPGQDQSVPGSHRQSHEANIIRPRRRRPPSQSDPLHGDAEGRAATMVARRHRPHDDFLRTIGNVDESQTEEVMGTVPRAVSSLRSRLSPAQVQGSRRLITAVLGRRIALGGLWIGRV